MEARERWQALQTQLTVARTRLDEGHRQAALEAVDAALAIDPNFLAAHFLRERILSDTSLNEQPSAPPPSEPSPAVGPPIATESYVRLEQRAKRRRVDRQLDTARAAIASNRTKEAAIALGEVGELDPNLPELHELTAQLSALEAARSEVHRGRWLAAAAAFGIVLLGASWLQDSVQFGRPIETAAPPVARVEPPAPTQAPPSESTNPVVVSVATTGAATSDAAVPRELPVVPGVTTARREPEPPTPAERRAVDVAFASPAPREIAEPVAPPVAPAILPASLPAPLPPPTAPPPAPAVATPPVVTAAARIPERIPEPVPAAAAASTGATNAASVVPTGPSDETLVKQTLQRYRKAYEGLDARSARAVWPAVNEAALARAFEGLQSQALTFDDCEVNLKGSAAAAATCRGSAQYVPKVGSHEPHVESRTWNFTLRKNGADWTIESARAGR